MVQAPINDPPSGPVPQPTATVHFADGCLTVEVAGGGAYVYSLAARALAAGAVVWPHGRQRDLVLAREGDTWRSTGAVDMTTAEAATEVGTFLRCAGCRLLGKGP